MKLTQDTEQDILPEYSFDYSKAKPNRLQLKIASYGDFGRRYSRGIFRFHRSE
jgi:hypothetical protein